MAYTHSLIASSTVGAGGVSAITFNNIPQNYTDLLVEVSVRNSGAYSYDYLLLRFNLSPATLYSTIFIQGSGTAGSSSAYSSESSIRVGFQPAGNNTASTFGNTDIYIPNYTGSNYKSLSANSIQENNATAANYAIVAGLWSNTTAVNAITLIPSVASFAEYSTAYLYGIRAGEY